MAVKTKGPAIGDDAVRAKTGRGWAIWFRLLDKAGAKKLTHREIAVLVSERFGAGPWWSQMVTVEYERARGLRAVHQVASGFSANVSRTYSVPASALASAFQSARTRAAWLKLAGVSVRSGMSGKVIRFDWPGNTRVEARFTAKGAGRSAVAIEHTRLAGAKQVASTKKLWGDALDRLRAKLERPRAKTAK